MKTQLGMVMMFLTLFISGNLLANRLSSDSMIIRHLVDGSLTVWTVAHFEKDRESQIQDAVDHIAGNQYLTIKFPDFRMQI